MILAETGSCGAWANAANDVNTNDSATDRQLKRKRRRNSLLAAQAGVPNFTKRSRRMARSRFNFRSAGELAGKPRIGRVGPIFGSASRASNHFVLCELAQPLCAVDGEKVTRYHVRRLRGRLKVNGGSGALARPVGRRSRHWAPLLLHPGCAVDLDELLGAWPAAQPQPEWATLAIKL